MTGAVWANCKSIQHKRLLRQLHLLQKGPAGRGRDMAMGDQRKWLVGRSHPGATQSGGFCRLHANPSISSTKSAQHTMDCSGARAQCCRVAGWLQEATPSGQALAVPQPRWQSGFTVPGTHCRWDLGRAGRPGPASQTAPAQPLNQLHLLPITQLEALSLDEWNTGSMTRCSQNISGRACPAWQSSSTGAQQRELDHIVMPNLSVRTGATPAAKDDGGDALSAWMHPP